MKENTFEILKVDQWLEENYLKMEKDLLDLMTFPSVEDSEHDLNSPFGKPIAEALNHALKIAASLGLEIQNIDGYMGIAEIKGISQESVGILSHVDVVPATPQNWQFPPFSPQIHNNYIYGRGAVDDKGPLIASLYAGAALKKVFNHSFSKTMRFMFGTNEESGFNCLKYYLSKYTPPQTGFSPDGRFPLVIGEKGLIEFEFNQSWVEKTINASFSLVSVSSGNAVNVIPEKAKAIIQKTNNSEIPKYPEIEILPDGEKWIIQAEGKSAHASTPEEGKNALSTLLSYLKNLPIIQEGAQNFIHILANLFSDDHYGTSFGIAEEDNFSRLTLIPSKLEITDKKGCITCDMRFPVTKKLSWYQKKLSHIATKHKFDLHILEEHEPLFVKEKNELVQKLLKAYRDFTGDMSQPLIIGGGTYAKALPGFLAFGPQFPHYPNLCHQANECIHQTDLLNLAKIYSRAIYELVQ